MLDHSHKPRPHGVDFQGVKISSEAAKAGANNFSWGPLHRSEVSYLLKKKHIKKIFFFFFWPHHTVYGDLSSLTRDQTHATCTGSLES